MNKIKIIDEFISLNSNCIRKRIFPNSKYADIWRKINNRKFGIELEKCLNNSPYI
jgi:hypothetical protein